MGILKGRRLELKGLLGGSAYWQIAAILLAACTFVAILGDQGRELFKYDRLAIEDGEFWRLATGHFAHLGTTHLVLNMAGLLLVWLLVGRYFSRLQWTVVIVISLATISAGFWFIDRGMLWYVGLSGGLHGLLVAGAIQGLRTLPSESAVVLAIVAIKLGFEQFSGPMPGSESVSGGPVVVNAHLFGAIGGILAAALLWRSAGGGRSI